MAATDPRKSLRKRIKKTIASWRNKSPKTAPPFDTAKLVVMALIMSDLPLTQKEVWAWIMGSCSYYRNIAAEAFWDHTSGSLGASPTATKVRETFDDVYQQYEVPLLVSSGSSAVTDDARYSVGLAAGESWLHLEAEVGTFPFFKLPAELRNTIYEMVFQYPASGLRLRWWSDQPEVLSRDLDDRSSWNEPTQTTFSTDPSSWNEPTQTTFSTKSLSSILCPLLTSHQFYHEAMPVLFEINTFHCAGGSDLKSVVATMPNEYCKHIRSFSIANFDLSMKIADGEDDGADDFGQYSAHPLKMLARLTNLRALRIYVLERPGVSGGVASAEWEDSEGVRILRTMRGLDKVDCPGIPALQELLEKDMCQPKIVPHNAGG
ncbi:hypothetical protein LTR97_002616 [Elasticomyces elasticus]|uniref:DUF7730 domain-containing protein n=1 Tax=Elasticomyces elasticus TaxID=574655 RepID=A0AAN7WHC8_9PEZI|nr:hypothetical protein LTR97_002616 [Elasticomyces elasticus]